MFCRVGLLPVIGLSLMLVVSSCGTVESAITGEGADTTQAADAESTTTAEPEPTTTTAQGYVSEGNGLPADELRQRLESVKASGGKAIDVQAFGFRFPVDAREGGDFWGFNVMVSEGSDPGDAQREAWMSYRYPYETFPEEKVEEFYEEVETELGQEGKRGEVAFEGVIPDITFELDDPIAGEQFLIKNGIQGEGGLTFVFFNLTTPSGNPSVVGDPEVYSSWFDGLVPIPADGNFTGGGASWGHADSPDRPGLALLAEFEFTGREQLEVEDEIKELVEDSSFTIAEGDSDLVLEDDDVIITYTFDAEEDKLEIAAVFKNEL